MNELTPSQKERLLIELTTSLFNGEITQGELLRKLRADYLELTQDAYAKLVGISRRSLHEVESDGKELNLRTLNKVFSPLGFKIGLIPKSPYVLKAASANVEND